MIIGISGKMRVGKTTAGSYLELKYGFKQVAFADALKKFARKLGWNGVKDDAGRKFLQDLGATVRNYDPNYWVDAAFREIAKQERLGYEHFAIPDMRYINETQSIREVSGILVRVWSPEELRIDTHPSETELDSFNDWDFKVESTKGDFNEYYSQIDTMMAQILSGTWQRDSKAEAKA